MALSAFLPKRVDDAIRLMLVPFQAKDAAGRIIAFPVNDFEWSVQENRPGTASLDDVITAATVALATQEQIDGITQEEFTTPAVAAYTDVDGVLHAAVPAVLHNKADFVWLQVFVPRVPGENSWSNQPSTELRLRSLSKVRPNDITTDLIIPVRSS